MSKPILCLDFDGVCHSYTSGWQGVDIIPDPPVEGLYDFLDEALKHFEVHIFSSRSHQKGGKLAMYDWLIRNRPAWCSVFVLCKIKFPEEKPPAMVTLDDRAITFMGVWPTIESLKNFKPWYKQ